MRVVSGICKGRPLKAVPGTGTRPTTDKVKESIFNMIGPYFEGGLVLDLFAGSGGLGIEALSRGMDKAIFVDRDFKANQTVKANLEICKFSERAEVYKNDSERALKALVKREITFQLIFLDPPYKKQKLVDLLEEIHKNRLLSNTGYIVCEHGHDVTLPDQVGDFTVKRKEVYGVIAVTIYHWGNVNEQEEL
ncbi:16S rRNA (guanine(966)-N(2))-methyltransferase RsmD [Peribacillus butanolivorans]|uniref:16S rRNA (guanine(966)-N(2))-methyltransferase RsmD n=1 Tax=Peribacillus butanolivorans TaxID=421767 RepID=UPI002E20B9FD|nr:16S rRNA (guanine(966)-N(2))-methyltransferase RsmD [Peribacillus butanolivorans]MED3691406.1 16S rRNA (guanine(966)-N(2))-methyltransferase RsmD [Peribacillus butanolivorans]